MAVGGVRGGGRGSAGAKGVAGKSTGATFKVTGNDAAGKTESLVGVSGTAGTAEAAPVAAADPIAAGAAQIAQALQSGQIASKSEATQKLVQLILGKKQLLGEGKRSKKLVEQISDTIQDDPRLAAALERTWARAQGGKKPTK